jgi:mannitol 2-dehydrogenase
MGREIVAPRRSTSPPTRRAAATHNGFIAIRELFGDLADEQRFVTAYRIALASLREREAHATLESLA